MKSIWTLTTLLIASTMAISQTNWYPQTTGNNTVLFDVHFTDQYHGWLCGNTGLVMHTEDGGANWIEQDAPPNNTYYGIYFADDQTGWAVGYSGKIIHTSDGGETWSNQVSGVNTYLYDLFFIDEMTGWVVGGDNGTFPSFTSHRFILHTNNGGQTWNAQVAETHESVLRSVHFTDAENGFAASETGTVLHTTDGGSSWEEIIVHQTYEFTGVSVVNSSTAFVVGEYLGLPHVPGIFKTTDSGATWTEQTFNGDISLIDIFFVDESNGWAVGGSNNLGMMLKTTDGGENWEYEDPGTDNYLFKAFFTDTETGWAVGQNGTVISTLLFTGIGDIVSEGSLSIYPNPASDRVSISLDVKESAPVSISLINALGQTVYREAMELPAGQAVHTIETSGLPTGYYFTVIENGSDRITERLIIR